MKNISLGITICHTCDAKLLFPGQIFFIQKYVTFMIDSYILTHWIGTSEILPCVRNSYLTMAILPRLSRDGYINWLYWNSRIRSSSDVIAMLK